MALRRQSIASLYGFQTRRGPILLAPRPGRPNAVAEVASRAFVLKESLAVGRLVRPLYSSNRSLVPVDFEGAIEASGPCAFSPWSRKRLTIG